MTSIKVRSSRATRIQNEGDMKHAPHVWTVPENAQISLDELRQEYLDHLEARSRPTSPETRQKYNNAILAMMRSLQRQKLPLVLESLTPTAINGWVKEQRKAGRSEDGIASRLGAVKVFTNNYLF